MTHGTQDWAGLTPKAVTFAMADMGELAVRLGSPVTFDRRGDVFWFTDFRSGLTGIEFTANGSGYDLYPLAHPVKSFGLSLGLQPGVAAGNYIKVRRFLAVPSLSAIGNEFSFVASIIMSTSACYVTYYNGTNRYVFGALYNHGDGGIYLWDNLAGWVLIDTPGKLYTYQNPWSTLKVVCDLDELKYVRVLYNNKKYDCKAYSPVVASDTTEAVLLLEIVTDRAGPGSPNYVAIGDWICTQAEPVYQG